MSLPTSKQDVATDHTFCSNLYQVTIKPNLPLIQYGSVHRTLINLAEASSPSNPAFCLLGDLSGLDLQGNTSHLPAFCVAKKIIPVN